MESLDNRPRSRVCLLEGCAGSAGHLNVPARAGALLQDTISALNVMATGDLSAMSDSDLSDSENHWEPHEDISPEYQPTLAATVGRAFYEVPPPVRPPLPDCPVKHSGSFSVAFLDLYAMVSSRSRCTHYRRTERVCGMVSLKYPPAQDFCPR